MITRENYASELFDFKNCKYLSDLKNYVAKNYSFIYDDNYYDVTINNNGHYLVESEDVDYETLQENESDIIFEFENTCNDILKEFEGYVIKVFSYRNRFEDYFLESDDNYEIAIFETEELAYAKMNEEEDNNNNDDVKYIVYKISDLTI